MTVTTVVTIITVSTVIIVASFTTIIACLLVFKPTFVSPCAGAPLGKIPAHLLFASPGLSILHHVASLAAASASDAISGAEAGLGSYLVHLVEGFLVGRDVHLLLSFLLCGWQVSIASATLKASMDREVPDFVTACSNVKFRSMTTVILSCS